MRELLERGVDTGEFALPVDIDTVTGAALGMIWSYQQPALAGRGSTPEVAATFYALLTAWLTPR